MSGLNPEQLLSLVVRPKLDRIGMGGIEAEQLIMGTGAVESHFVWLKQVGGGPALGLWQMEPFTFRDILSRCSGELLTVVFEIAGTRSPTPDMLVGNLGFAAVMARLKYRDARPALPAAWDIAAMEVYHKRYYNSAIGATRPGEFARAWSDVIAPSARRMWP